MTLGKAINNLKTWEVYDIETEEIIMQFRTKGAARNMLSKLRANQVQQLKVRRVEE